MKYLIYFFLLFVVWLGCQPKRIDFHIEQIESDAPVIIKYNREKNHIPRIYFPFTYYYENRSTIPLMAEVTSYHYNEKPENVAMGANPTDWSSSLFVYEWIDGSLVRTGRRRSQRKDYVKPGHSKRFVVYNKSGFRLPDEFQPEFQPYIDEIKRLGTDSLYAGSLSEFTGRHPEFCEIVLQGDSIDFVVRNTRNEWEDSIELPIGF